MDVFVVTATDPTFGTQVHGVHWTRWHAERNLENMEQTFENCQIHEVRLDPLSWLVNSYFKSRNLTDPDANDALYFLTSETGELADAFVHGRGDWVRNNPQDKAGKRIDYEAGDVLMMLIKFSQKMGFDPLTAMVEKFRSKGWR
jgi:NTP pyrophosphatase (non-canonical NTP hydrolase)